MGELSRYIIRILAAVAALSSVSCDRRDSPRPGSGERVPVATASSSEDRRAQLLNRIRAADPQQQTIVRALLNERNELGLVLNRSANLDDVPKLLRAMLAQLDETFPGQDHVAIAYAPTDPPRVIGTARLNARTRDMTYTPASR